MADSVSVKVNGIDELKRALAALPSKIRRKALVKALRSAAKVVLGEARARVPLLATPVAYRTRGLLKKQLTVRTSKESRQQGNVGVFVNVRPAAAAKFKSLGKIAGIRVRIKKTESKRGAKSPLDPYYWRFVEFGTKKMTARPFLQPAAAKLPEALAAFEREAIPAIEALNKPGA